MPAAAVEAEFAAALDLRQLGRLDEAGAALASVLARAPEHAEAWHMLGVLLCQRGRLDEGADKFRAAVRLAPGRVLYLCDLGAAERELGRLDEALRSFDQAAAIAPVSADVQNSRAEVLSALRRHAQALQGYERAHALAPHDPRAANNAGAACLELLRYAEAADWFERALRLMPGYAPAHANQGVALHAAGEFELARRAYQRALSLRADHAEAHWNLGLLDLLERRFETGWRGYEWRWARIAAEPARHTSLARWQGQDLSGKSILLWSEQGLGDCIQFCRYAPMLAARGAIVMLELPAALCALAQCLPGVARVLREGEMAPDCDFQLPLGSLPAVLGTRATTIPAAIPYLGADKSKVAAWRQRRPVPAIKPRIGLACSGNRALKNDGNRSLPLERLAPLFEFGELVLLQTEVREEDEATLRGSRVRDLRADLRDFSDTAAVIDGLDLVISVDTAVAHLAGAMGKDVWILLPFVPDWRWQLQRADSPWYPSARLFRQPEPGRWDAVVQDVVTALKERT
jgi:tetratricopeptide (TPR) repeat protein